MCRKLYVKVKLYILPTHLLMYEKKRVTQCLKLYCALFQRKLKTKIIIYLQIAMRSVI